MNNTPRQWKPNKDKEIISELLNSLKRMTNLFEQDHFDCLEWVQYLKAQEIIKKAEAL